MTKQKWKSLLFWVISALAAGALSGLISRKGMESFSRNILQPPLSPPPILFPIVWTILYTLMGYSAYRIATAESKNISSRGLNLYVAQLIVNFFWSPIFFNAQAYGFSLLWLLLLWILVLLMILEFRKTDPIAAYLQIPYLLWLTFAAYLNFSIWQLNR